MIIEQNIDQEREQEILAGIYESEEEDYYAGMIAILLGRIYPQETVENIVKQAENIFTVSGKYYNDRVLEEEEKLIAEERDLP